VSKRPIKRRFRRVAWRPSRSSKSSDSRAKGYRAGAPPPACAEIKKTASLQVASGTLYSRHAAFALAECNEELLFSLLGCLSPLQFDDHHGPERADDQGGPPIHLCARLTLIDRWIARFSMALLPKFFGDFMDRRDFNNRLRWGRGAWCNGGERRVGGSAITKRSLSFWLFARDERGGESCRALNGLRYRNEKP
jgi:hypothetical protein